ncbi:MAG: transposase [Conexivisphaera sp.]
MLDALNQEIEKVSRRIREEAIEDEDARLLMTIPGISYYSALLIAGEIGDISRFPDSDSDHLVSYAGLSPSTHSSGGRTCHGPITEQGSRSMTSRATEHVSLVNINQMWAVSGKGIRRNRRVHYIEFTTV